MNLLYLEGIEKYSGRGRSVDNLSSRRQIKISLMKIPKLRIAMLRKSLEITGLIGKNEFFI